MNEWPEGRTEDADERYGRGSSSNQPEGARVMRHVQRQIGRAHV